LGRRLGEELSGEGLLDDWILDLIAACERPPTTRKEGFEEVLERLRRAWRRLGIDAERALAPLIEEVYEELGRSELLILLYNGRTEPSGRRGRAASFVDVLEILVEAARKAGGWRGSWKSSEKTPAESSPRTSWTTCSRRAASTRTCSG